MFCLQESKNNNGKDDILPSSKLVKRESVQNILCSFVGSTNASSLFTPYGSSMRVTDKHKLLHHMQLVFAPELTWHIMLLSVNWRMHMLRSFSLRSVEDKSGNQLRIVVDVVHRKVCSGVRLVLRNRYTKGCGSTKMTL